MRKFSKRYLIPIGVTLINAELGSCAWQIARFSVFKAFIFSSISGTCEMLFWYYGFWGSFLGKTLHKFPAVVISLMFVGVGYLFVRYLNKEKRLFYSLPGIFKKRLKIAGVASASLILAIGLLSIIGKNLKVVVFDQDYLGVFISGLIPTFFHLGIGFIKLNHIQYGLLILLIGNICKIGLFSYLWQKIIPLIGLDKIDLNSGSVWESLDNIKNTIHSEKT
ncbi:MAG: hypothetical protein HYW77_02465 [Parcubacteria group bacterium]|nr:hypothetical protein [Parcubacteria group bacterium]